MALITLAETKTWIGVPGAADDALLTALIVRVTEFLQVQTGRYFGDPIEHTEYLDGAGSGVLWLNEPAVTMTSVEERSAVGDAWTAIPTGDVDGWEQRGRMLIRKGGMRWSSGTEYRVIYDFGYATGPEDIRQLALDLVKLKYGEREYYTGLESYQIGDTRWTRALGDEALSGVPFVAETLAHWRGMRRGVA